MNLGSFAALALAVAVLAPPAAAKPVGPKPNLGPATAVAAGVTSRPVTFTSPSGQSVTGEIISGTGRGRHPGVLFVHWLGDPKTTNHTEFEADAVALAKRGATSVLVDTMWARKDWFDKVGTSAEADLAQAKEQLAELSAALDVLEGQPRVDPHRIAYVGHDFGAMFGALLAREDDRPRVFVLMAGVPTMSEWYLLGKPHPDGYVQALDTLDIRAGIGRSKARAMLFQFADHDHYVAADRAQVFAAARTGPKRVITYDADHSLAVPQAAADRQAWLTEQLFSQ